MLVVRTTHGCAVTEGACLAEGALIEAAAAFLLVGRIVMQDPCRLLCARAVSNGG